MSLLLGFAPFGAFAVLGYFGRVTLGLWSAAGIAGALLLGSQLPPRRSVKVLEAGGAALFLGLAFAAAFLHPHWSLLTVRLAVAIGLCAIVTGSILVGQPFTIQYARQQAPPERWNHPLFIKANRRISAVWAAAFAVDALCTASVVWLPWLPILVPVVVNVLAYLAAMRFTIEYPRRLRARAAR